MHAKNNYYQVKTTNLNYKTIHFCRCLISLIKKIK